MTKQIGKAIKINRIKQELSVEQLAERAGTSQGYLSEVERGKYTPGIKLLSRIAAAFNMPMWQLIKEAEELQNEANGN